MSKPSRTSSSTSSRARTIASEGEDVRTRIRDLTARTIRDRKVAAKDLSRVFNQILDGAKQGVSDALPSSQKSVLRKVLEGVNEAVDVATRSASGAVREAKARGKRVVKKDAAAAARGVRDAHEQFLAAAGTLARRLSGEVRAEVEDVVARARRAGPKIGSAAGGALQAADGHLLELTGEAARAGVRVARGTLGGLMMATGGLLEGLGESVAPRRKPKPAGATKPRRTGTGKRPRKARASSKKRSSKRKR